MLKETLDQRVMDLLAKRYWNKPVDDLNPVAYEVDSLASLPTAPADSLIWQRKLDASSGELTKLGIGRLATTVVAGELQNQVETLIAASTFASHPYAQKAIRDASSSILNERFYSTSDQVENCIKPYKFEIEIEDNEWSKGRENVGSVLKGELKACGMAEKHLEDAVGKKKLRDVMGFVDRVRKGDVVLEGDGSGGAGGFSNVLLQKGKTSTPTSVQVLIVQAAKQSSCVTEPRSSRCDSLLSSRSSAAPAKTDTTAQKSSWTSWPTSSHRRLCSSSTLNC